MQLEWTRSATKHRISREQSRYVIERCGLRFKQEPPAGAPANASPRLIFLGDDARGAALEVMVIELEGERWLVIHAMSLREHYRRQYEEAKRWRKIER